VGEELPSLDERKFQLEKRELWLKTAAAVVLVLSGVGSVVTFFLQRHQQGVEQLAQQRKDRAIRKQELRLRMFQEKKAAYLPLVVAASQIAAARDRNEVDLLAPKFEVAFYRVHLVPSLDDEVVEMKVAFHTALDIYQMKKSDESPAVLTQDVLNLARACHDCLNKQLDDSTDEAK
jgi:hypothetical protein